MTDNQAHTILIVDDEEANTKALNRLFRRAGYRALTASSGAEGLELLKASENPISLIISDERMPEMTGSVFLEKAKGIYPDATRFLLTGFADMDALVDAVNRGEVHRYLNKPWDDDDLLAQVQHGVRQFELITENKRLTEVIQQKNAELETLNKNLESQVVERTRILLKKHSELEKSFVKTFRLGSSLVEMINPTLGGYLSQVGRLSKEVARALGLEESLIIQIEIAGMFHDIGLIGMPEELLEKQKSDMDPVELDLYTQHPMVAAISFEDIPQLEEAGTIIINHHELFDGSGYPHGLAGEEIPIGARILTPVSYYCRILNTWPTEVGAIRQLAHKRFGDEINDILGEEDPEKLLEKIAERALAMGAGSRYDMAIVEKLEDILEGRKQQEEGLSWIDVDFIREGMVLQKSVSLADGRVIMSKGIRLKSELVASLQKLKAHGKIEPQVYVSVPSKGAGK